MRKLEFRFFNIKDLLRILNIFLLFIPFIVISQSNPRFETENKFWKHLDNIKGGTNNIGYYSEDTLFVNYNNIKLEEGKEDSVDFYFTANPEIAAFQLTLVYDTAKFEFLELNSLLDSLDFPIAYAHVNNELRVLGYSDSYFRKGNDNPVFRIKFKSHTNIDLCEIFSLGISLPPEGTTIEGFGLQLVIKCRETSNTYDINYINDVIIVPNPVEKSFSINSTGGGNIFIVRIYDIFGNIILDKNYKQSDNGYIFINGDILPLKGIYFITVGTEKGFITKRIIKN